ncbi:MAG: nickel-dependent hydrogenase large subunit [Actinobacteria bacterium]|nr:nickel-dependent hydrogenase large subunit [Actinomycetota bacterium]
MTVRRLFKSVSRTDNHITLLLELKEGTIVDANLSLLIFRGFEDILADRNIYEIPYFASRICGKCFSSHQIAAVRAIENALSIEVPYIAILARNLMLASVFLINNLRNFYQNALPDFVNLRRVLEYSGSDEELLILKDRVKKMLESKDTSPFASIEQVDEMVIDYPSDVIQLVFNSKKAIKIQNIAGKMGTLLGGKYPHYQSIIVGGVSRKPNLEDIVKFKSFLDEVSSFVKEVYAPDVISLVLGPLLESTQNGIGMGFENYLCYKDFFNPIENKYLFPSGIIISGKLDILEDNFFDNIIEDSSYSFQKDLNEINLKKANAYTFCLAPRYKGLPFETGPLARLLILKEKNLTKLMNQYSLKPGFGLRHLARALETVLIVDEMYAWLEDLLNLISKEEAVVIRREKENNLKELAAGFHESPCGTTIHTIEISRNFIKNYRVIGGSTWNASPKDSRGLRGPAEESLIGLRLKNEKQTPLMVRRILNSFDLCSKCATH